MIADAGHLENSLCLNEVLYHLLDFLDHGQTTHDWQVRVCYNHVQCLVLLILIEEVMHEIKRQLTALEASNVTFEAHHF